MLSLFRRILGIGKKSENRISHIEEVRRIAFGLANYFGTHCERVLEGDPIKVGNWALDVMEGIYHPEVYLLRAIANNAIARNSWPPDHSSATKASEQVASGIGVVCQYLVRNGVPAPVKV